MNRFVRLELRRGDGTRLAVYEPVPAAAPTGGLVTALQAAAAIMDGGATRLERIAIVTRPGPDGGETVGFDVPIPADWAATPATCGFVAGQAVFEVVHDPDRPPRLEAWRIEPFADYYHIDGPRGRHACSASEARRRFHFNPPAAWDAYIADRQQAYQYARRQVMLRETELYEGRRGHAAATRPPESDPEAIPESSREG